ncbi:Acyl-CoA synthetase [Fusarium oxysporum f. sp. matthiolae]|nr:Acyl-CoA synthetase [Fusarium oxysporum f. sp. matthiolae]
MDYTSGLIPLKQVHKPPFTVEAPGYAKIPGETVPRRHPCAKGGLINRPVNDVHTVFDIVRRSARVYPNHRAVGSRKLVKLYKERRKVQKVVDGEIQELEKEWQLFELSKSSYLTFKEYEQLALQVGYGLRRLGLTSKHKLHLFGTTSISWISMSHGCASQSISIVTAYDTLGESGLEHTLLQTKADAMYVDPHLLQIAARPLKKSNVKTVIVNEGCIFATGDEIEEFKRAHAELKVLTFEELRKMGEDNPVDSVPAKGPDLYCIMYTSGSTGPPKGVCITHEALVAGVAGLYTCVEECVSDKEDVLAYLPLAHVFEMALENLVLFIGGTLGYGNPRTLADSSVKNCVGDMREFRPTVMVGVPQIWETVKKGVIAKLDASSPVIKALFWSAFSFKTFMSRKKLPGAGIFDKIVFSKVRELTGGRLRFTMNGASGISAGTRHFLSMVLAPMLGGYGLTESCANGALGCPLEYSPNAIGPVPAAIEVKLVSIPDIGYSTDAEVPQGEIWLKGVPIIKEYYDNPEETNMALTRDGWFKSGDIGEFDDNGHLRVIDRIKNLVKTQGGEYIALEKLESVYRGTQTIINVMVHADSQHSRPIAVVMPNETVLAEKIKGLGVNEQSMHYDPKVRSLILKDLQSTGKRSGLASMEIVSGVVITDEEWTPPSGLVTATHKLNRKVIREKFKKEIDECLKNAP